MLLILATGTDAATITPSAALQRFVTAPQLQASWFTPAFLAQVPLSTIQSVRASIEAQLGAFEGSTPQSQGTFLLHFAHGSDVAQISLDAQGRIAGLLFKPPIITGTTLASVVQHFRALPGKVSVLVLAGNDVRAALNDTRSLGVGSAFKLAVLAALQRQIVAGVHHWDEVVTLSAADRSLPSGILQNWPAGSHLTIETLASLMISQSDNTAADTLIHLVGRQAIDALIPASDRPILTTHAAFVLKDPTHAALLQAYQSGNEAQRLSVVEQAEQMPLPSAALFTSPRDLDVEWFFTPHQLCRLMEQVQQLPLMTINPGLAQPADWRSLAFKGGSEPGVLNLTTALTTHSGANYCVVATWNNSAALDETRFESLYVELLTLL